MTNNSQLNRLQIGAIRQLGRQVKELTEQNIALTAQLAQIDHKGVERGS